MSELDLSEREEFIRRTRYWFLSSPYIAKTRVSCCFSHPVSSRAAIIRRPRAIMKGRRRKGVELADADEFRSITGKRHRLGEWKGESSELTRFKARCYPSKVEVRDIQAKDGMGVG